MPESGDQSHPAPQLGDYRLQEVISEGVVTRTYLAEQISIDRAVVLERIKQSIEIEPGLVENFLSDVRAKASVDHPGIGSVYEAIHDDEVVFYTREYLPGETFENLHDANRTFEPAVVATFLRQVGSAMEYYQQRDVATLPLEPRHLVLGEHSVLRMANLAVADQTDLVVEGHDRFLIGELFLDLLERGLPGATRTRRLLEMMTSEEGTELSWTQIVHTARKLEQDLSEGSKVASQAGGVAGKPVRAGAGRQKAILGVVATLLILGALGAGGFFLSNRKARPGVRDLSQMVEIPAGSYQTGGGKEVTLKRFWIDAHEVTIAEYAAFLEALATLPRDKRSAYDHVKQPVIKRDHIPDGWDSMLMAARAGSSLDGLVLDPNCPVTQVDWWDAHAYANWKGGRLPTQDEWAAAVVGTPDPAGWGPVDVNVGDLTTDGIHGLAGNVSEWTETLERNPAFPMNPKGPLACGASYLTPRNGAQARTWLPSKEMRRRDLGFRLVRDAAP